MLKKSLCFLFLLSVVFGTPLQAQITDTANIPEPTAISVLELNSKMELVTQQLKNTKSKTNLPSDIIEIDTLMPQYKLKVIEQTEAFYNFKKSHPNKEKVLNLINTWGSYNEHLNLWQEKINGHLDRNSTYLEQLKRQNKQWLLTYQNAQKENVPYEVLQLIRGTRKTISDLIIKLNKQNRQFISLETSVLILKEKINSVLNELDAWKQSEEFALLYQRHLAIWNLAKEPEPNENEIFDAWSSFKGNLRGVYFYLRSTDNNISLFIILFFVLNFWLWRIRRSYKKMKIGEKNKTLISFNNVIVNHFISSVIFLTTIFSIIYFSHTPNLLSEFFLFVLIISAIPLLNELLHKQFKGLVYFILLLFLLDTAKSYVWYSSGLYRTYLFIEAIVAILVIFKMSHPYLKTRRLALNDLSHIFVRFVPVLYLIFTAAIVFNILGYTNFTDFLLKIGILGNVLVVILYGMLTILKGFSHGITHYYFSRIEKFNINNKIFIEKRANQWIAAFAYIFTFIYFLHVIDVYQNVVLWLNDFLTEPKKAGTISFTWGSIFNFLMVLIASFGVTSFISRIIDGGALNPLKLPKGIPAILSVIIRYFIIAFAIVVALSMLGIELGEFNLMAGALGLGIGFGLQNIIANFISGLILIFERPIQKSDVVEVGPLLGEVKKIGVRSSNIRTFNGAEVVVPNNNLITNEVINWTLSDNVKRIEIKIGAAYGSDLQKVVDILREVALAHKNVLQKPIPSSLFDEFGDSSLNFRLLFWVPVEFGISSKSEISIAIYNRFKAEGITIPFPQRDMNFRKEDLDALKGKDIENKGG